MKSLLAKLSEDFPAISFQAGKQFCWSPKDQKIVFKALTSPKKVGIWSLLHEVGHATLGHQTYKSDFELLQLEVAAWQEAQNLAAKYSHTIDIEHVQDCLDTYRDWLHLRSSCPMCGNKSLQESLRLYTCFNCDTKWQVTTSRFCRPYRRLVPISSTSEYRNLRQIPNFR